MLNFLNAQCVAEGGKISSSDGQGQFCNFMVASWTNCPPLYMTGYAKC